MLRKTTPPARAIVYYVPFVPRPAVLVTRGHLDKLAAVEVSGVVLDRKEAVTKALVNHFGTRVITPHPHLWPGTVVRSLVVWMPAAPLIALSGEPVLLALFCVAEFCYLTVMLFELGEATHLWSAYEALCGE